MLQPVKELVHPNYECIVVHLELVVATQIVLVVSNLVLRYPPKRVSPPSQCSESEFSVNHFVCAAQK